MAIPRNQRFRQDRFTEPILRFVHELTEEDRQSQSYILLEEFAPTPGADLQDIISRVHSEMGHLFNEIDRGRLRHNEIRWQNTVRQEIADLIEAGLIERVMRGRFRLTEAGRRRINL